MKAHSKGEKQFTASVWILSTGNPKKMLLLHHKKLGKWQQPGGHIDEFENPIEAAIREVKEETGLEIEFLKERLEVVDHESTFLPVPDFVMEQKIQARGEEEEHYHIDINYVVEIDEQKLTHNIAEAYDIKWFTKEEIASLSTHGDTKVIVDKLLT